MRTGTRGAVAGETWVAVDGVADGALVLRGSTGALREGTQVRMGDAAGPAGGASATSPSGALVGAARP